jgi:hypothetical protein
MSEPALIHATSPSRSASGALAVGQAGFVGETLTMEEGLRGAGIGGVRRIR